jgi:hypothetical protein
MTGNGSYIAALTAYPAAGIYYCTNFTGQSTDIFTLSASSVPGALIVSLSGLNGIASCWQSGSTSNVLYYTKNGGVTWTNSGFVGSTQTFGACILSGLIGVAMNSLSQYYVTKNAGVTWTAYNAPTGSTQLTAIATSNGNAIMYDNALSRMYYGKVP